MKCETCIKKLTCEGCGKVIETLTIDCDKEPFNPEGWKVETHKKGGVITWDASKVSLYLSEKQKNGTIEGNKLRKELEGKNVLNANVLEFLLEHQELIPEAWKDKYVYFWGTIYRGPDGRRFVLYLYWNDGRWDWSYDWLVDDWYVNNPSAVLASI